MSGIAESHVEEAALAWLGELGYGVAIGLNIGPDGSAPERASYGDVILASRLKEAIARLNPHLKADTREEVFRKLLQSETPSLTEENRRLHRFFVEGVPVEVTRADGSIGGDSARLIDFDDVDANDWLAVNQFTVIENKANRRPDIVLFVNGLPVSVIELKNPGDENATMDGAFNQLQTYKTQISSTFRTNAVLVISDGMTARIGSLTADRERFMPWRTLTGDLLAPKGVPELETLLKGAFDKRRFLDLIKDFVVSARLKRKTNSFRRSRFSPAITSFTPSAAPVTSTIEATRSNGDRKVGVVWHTQGSARVFSWRSTPGRSSSTRTWKTLRCWLSPTVTTSTTSSSGPSTCAKTCCGRLRNRPRVAKISASFLIAPPAA